MSNDFFLFSVLQVRLVNQTNSIAPYGFRHDLRQNIATIFVIFHENIKDFVETLICSRTLGRIMERAHLDFCSGWHASTMPNVGLDSYFVLIGTVLAYSRNHARNSLEHSHSVFPVPQPSRLIRSPFRLNGCIYSSPGPPSLPPSAQQFLFLVVKEPRVRDRCILRPSHSLALICADSHLYCHKNNHDVAKQRGTISMSMGCIDQSLKEF